MGPAALVLDDVRLELGTRTVFDGLCLTVPAGAVVAVLGPSGVGKTSLLRVASGLQRPDAGRVERAPGRIGYAFQEPRLLPWRTAIDNVLLPAGRRPGPPVRDRAHLLLDAFGLADAAGMYPEALSGGMRQRVALARALLVPPALLLVDEPLGAVHQQARRDMAVTARRLVPDAAVLWVTHDPLEAAAVADEIVEMDRSAPGGLRRLGAPEPDSVPASSVPSPDRRTPCPGRPASPPP